MSSSRHWIHRIKTTSNAPISGPWHNVPRRGNVLDVVGKVEGPGEAVEDDVLQVEELPHGVPDAGEGEQVDALDQLQVVPHHGHVEEVQDQLGHHPPEGEPREEEGEGHYPPRVPGRVLCLQAVVELFEPVAGKFKIVSQINPHALTTILYSDLIIGPDTTTGM